MSADNGWLTAAHSGAYYLNCLSEFLGILLAFNRFTALFFPLKHDQFWLKFTYVCISLCVGIAFAPWEFQPSIWFNMVIVTLASNGVASLLYASCIARLCMKSNRHNTIAERNLFVVGFWSMLFSLPYMTAMVPIFSST
ncbi:hypothetical protein PRIPAC_82467 [Pristionchus pacificus]|uniref:Serpentine receptor class gamma n=1 Tax=Pristionchus pacificus TaxID=54126 RepID=A0A2A6C2F0_PRIPA|nr:hypothetical protein PRIPAC_82467 [Pristionchus pacificus]|eukprot:PDM72203.1 G protein-coupled receptor [Pristionchus pacificus]